MDEKGYLKCARGEVTYDTESYWNLIGCNAHVRGVTDLLPPTPPPWFGITGEGTIQFSGFR